MIVSCSRPTELGEVLTTPAIPHIKSEALELPFGRAGFSPGFAAILWQLSHTLYTL